MSVVLRSVQVSVQLSKQVKAFNKMIILPKLLEQIVRNSYHKTISSGELCWLLASQWIEPLYYQQINWQELATINQSVGKYSPLLTSHWRVTFLSYL